MTTILPCAACGHENRAGAKYCARCGVYQGGRCAVCGNPLAPADAFCVECGRPAASDSQPGRAVSVSDQQLQRLTAELRRLEADLIERELELSSTQAELRAFELRYMRTVGAKLAELDRLYAEIAHRRAAHGPTESVLEAEAKEAERQARASEEAVGAAAESPDPAQRFEPSDSLRALYRRAAKLMHPDLAADDIDRVNRVRFMQRANAAYQAGDEDTLERLITEWSDGLRTPVTHGKPTLATVEADLERCRTRIAAIDAELRELRLSPMWRLKERVAAAQADGQDLLADMLHVAEQDALAAAARLREMSTNE